METIVEPGVIEMLVMNEGMLSTLVGSMLKLARPAPEKVALTPLPTHVPIAVSVLMLTFVPSCRLI